MAQQTTVTLTDDLDGSKAAETVSFGIDGRTYDIDLSKKNAAALRKTLGQFTAAGRPVRSGKPAGKRADVSPHADAKAVREWAQSEGIAVSARGRVPADLIDRYLSANG